LNEFKRDVDLFSAHRLNDSILEGEFWLKKFKCLYIVNPFLIGRKKP